METGWIDFNAPIVPQTSGYIPERGEYWTFKSPSHVVYDCFPCGRKIPHTEVFVDFAQPMKVIEARVGNVKRWSRRYRRNVHSEYVAIKFEVDDRWLWTNYSRDGERWMWTASEMFAWASTLPPHKMI